MRRRRPLGRRSLRRWRRCSGGYNPNSLHAEGRAARAAVDAAREAVARVLGATPREIVFTGGGSESDVLAIVGAARAAAARGRHVVTVATEHHAVLHAVDVLERDGWRVTRLPVDRRGLVDPAAFAAALTPETTLASVMLANNEIGVVQPVAELARIARERGVLLHTDAVQAPGWLPLDVEALGVDLLSLSAHKFYGPKGVGVLYVRRGTALEPLIVGGGQEHGLRAGTENVAGIAGLRRRARRSPMRERAATAPRVAALRDRLEAGIVAAVPGRRRERRRSAAASRHPLRRVRRRAVGCAADPARPRRHRGVRGQRLRRRFARAEPRRRRDRPRRAPPARRDSVFARTRHDRRRNRRRVARLTAIMASMGTPLVV